MRTRCGKAIWLAPTGKRWSQSHARIVCSQQQLLVLPTRTRPSLFASD